MVVVVVVVVGGGEEAAAADFCIIKYINYHIWVKLQLKMLAAKQIISMIVVVQALHREAKTFV